MSGQHTVYAYLKLDNNKMKESHFMKRDLKKPAMTRAGGQISCLFKPAGKIQKLDSFQVWGLDET